MAGNPQFPSTALDIDLSLDAAIKALQDAKNPLIDLQVQQVGANSEVIKSTKAAITAEDAINAKNAVALAKSPFSTGNKEIPSILSGSILDKIPGRITGRGKLR